MTVSIPADHWLSPRTGRKMLISTVRILLQRNPAPIVFEHPHQSGLFIVVREPSDVRPEMSAGDRTPSTFQVSYQVA